LAKITSENEWEFTSQYSADPNYPYWIGLTDLNEVNNYTWVDGTPLTFSRWLDGEPDGEYHERCVVQTTANSQSIIVDDADAYWSDYPCSNKHGGICESRRESGDSRLMILNNNSRESCVEGWHLYNGRCYKLTNTAGTWADVKSMCMSMSVDADLVTIHSESEWDFTKSITDSNNRVWIGLSDYLEHGNYVWVDGSALSLVDKWFNLTDPDGHYGSRCVSLTHRDEKTGLEDNMCGIELKGLCEH